MTRQRISFVTTKSNLILAKGLLTPVLRISSALTR